MIESDRRTVIYWIVVVGLLVGTGGSWALRELETTFSDRRGDAPHDEAVYRAERHIQGSLDSIQLTMEQAARSTEALVRPRLEVTGPVPDVEVIRILAELNVPERWSLEVYDRRDRLLAWHGESVPRMSAPSGRWSIASDGVWRQALVLWHPITTGTTDLGAVRVTRLVSAQAPVRNAVLQDYAISDTWSREVKHSVRATFGHAHVAERPLQSIDGSVLGSYALEPGIESQITETRLARLDDAQAFWLMLLLVWAAMGVWWWQLRQARVYRLGGFVASLIAVRFLLLWLNAPGRFQAGKAPLSPLFDPVHYASSLFGGLFQSTGDLLLTVVTLCWIGVAVARYAAQRRIPKVMRPWAHGIRLLLAVLASLSLTAAAGQIIRSSVLDSTLDYVSRSSLIPGSIELVVFGSLTLLLWSVALTSFGILRLGLEPRPSPVWITVVGAVAAACAFLADPWCPWPVSLLTLGSAGYVAFTAQQQSFHAWLTVRRVVLGALGACLLIYPVFFQGLAERKRARVEFAAASFDPGHNPEVSMAVREIVESALEQEDLMERLAAGQDLEETVGGLMEGKLLTALGAYDAYVSLWDAEGNIQYESGRPVSLDAASELALFAHLRRELTATASAYLYVDPQTPGGARYQYAGLGALGGAGWILVRAQPHVLLEEANTPLLRIMLSAGYRDLFAGLSLASFQDGLLTRSIGRSFSRFRMDPDAEADLGLNSTLWRTENINGREYVTYYLKRDDSVVAVRSSTIRPFDHLYSLLRLAYGAILAAVPICLAGLVLRWRSGLVPPTRTRFQDKVLTAFVLLGIIAVIPIGIAGYRVITEENEGALQSWLRQHLQRVESTLAAESMPGETAADALERTDIGALAARVGLDLNLYQGASLIASSRPQLADDRVVDVRLPAVVYEAVHGRKDRFTFVNHRLGEFSYTAGYRAILDASGTPRYVLSAPTIPEAERIEEERARTLAYLFGALLALSILVMFTASLLARALAQPIARLQQGLRDVADGRFERELPVQSRDEVGQLVETFNEMQGQLKESRQKLAHQERQLAWREMARQVAHEIKNPLTPMKLSIQHLQRAFQAVPVDRESFQQQFQRVTSTLVAQIESLARIANEFATFARLPSREVETLDVRDVLHEAYVLMRAEAPAHVTLDLQVGTTRLPVKADRGELHRTFINLVKNALQALADTPSGTIVLSAKAIDSLVACTITDNGAGIPESARERIFEPSFSTKTSGAGLGLAIARQSIEAVGGSIDFESEPGQGTAMHIRLPLLVEV